MKVITSLIIIYLPGFLAGALIARRRSCHVWGRIADSLAFGPLIAMATVTLLMFYRKFLGHAFPGLGAIVLTSALVLLGFVSAFFCRRPLEQESCKIPASPYLAALGMLALGAFLWSSAFFWKRTHAVPAGDWDGLAIWNTFGRFFSRFDGNIHDRLQLFRLSHPEYPPMLPGTLATANRLSESESNLIPQVVAYFGFVSFVFLILRFGRRLSGLSAGFFVATIAAATPLFVVRSAGQYADVLTAAVHVAAVGGLALHLKRPTRSSISPWVVGLFLGLLPWIKNEGWIHGSIALATFMAIGIIPKVHRRVLIMTTLKIAVGATPGFLAWVLFRSHWAPADQLTASGISPVLEALGDPGRWRLAYAHFSDEVSNQGHLDFWHREGGGNIIEARWALFWPGVVLTAIIAAIGQRWRTRVNLYLLIIALSQFSAVFLVFVAIPKQEWHLNTAMPRLLLQIAPTFLLLLAALLPPDRDQR